MTVASPCDLWSIIITSCNHIREVIVCRAIAITAVIMRSLGCQLVLQIPLVDWCAQCRSSWVDPLGRSNPKNHPREISYVGIQAR